MSFIKEHAGYWTLAVRVTPRASRAKILGNSNERLRIALTAPPVENAANESLIEFLSELLGIPKRAISIIQGLQGREKLLRIEGLLSDQVPERLIKK